MYSIFFRIQAGYPVKNGLYDPAFGPTDMHESCETCGLKEQFCPGHYGHIKLSVPVFNPMFFSVTLEVCAFYPISNLISCFKIMKGSCFYCSRFTGISSSPEAKILKIQLDFIDKGLSSVAENIQAELNIIFASRREDKRKRKPAPKLDAQEERQIIKQMNEIINKNTAENLQTEHASKPVKNTLELRNKLIKDFLKNHLVNKLITWLDSPLCFSYLSPCF